MKILNFGSLNIDYTYRVKHFAVRGETVPASGLQIFPGGKGLNQSIALAKSGAVVWHAGAVGKDDGGFLLERLVEAGAHTDFIYRLDDKSGHAIIQNTEDGDNCILIYGGCNQLITEEMVTKVLTHFEAGDFLVLQNEISSLGYLMKKACEKGMRIVWNPSPFDEELLSFPISDVEYLLINEIEGRELCGIHSCEAESDEIVELLSKKFPATKIVLTLGKAGAVCLESGKQIFQPGYSVKAVDTTAAGDTFTGYFIGGISKGMPTETALRYAAAAAAISVTRPGAASSIPGREEVERLLAKHPEMQKYGAQGKEE